MAPASPSLFGGRVAPPDPLQTELVAEVLRVRQRWENADGSAAVVADLTDGRTLKGELDAGEELVEGERYCFLGRWQEHHRWGWQFHFAASLAEVPADPGGVISYLAKHCPGVGPATAQRLYDAYGAAAVRVLADDPARVAGDGHLAEDVAQAGADALCAVCDPALRDAHLELHALLRGHGFYAKATKAALRRWKARAPRLVRRDPFLLMTQGLPGCGFLKCDRLYSALGLPRDRMKRQALAAWYALARLDGDTWAPLSAAFSAVRAQIGSTAPRERRALALLCRARQAEVLLGPEGKFWAADRGKAADERAAALHVRRLSSAAPAWPAGPYDGLSEHQQAELARALAGPVALLTGSPGTGKTHCAAAVIHALCQSAGSASLAVCAPTGKAAVRITEKMREAGMGLVATTIHRLLGVKDTGAGLGFERGELCPLPLRFVVVDESSMIDASLLAALLRACGDGTHLLFVGDPNQLPPVGHGAPLRDLIAAGLPCATLSEVRRNAGAIVHACARIKDGKAPAIAPGLTSYPAHNLVHLAWGKDEARSRIDLLCGQLDGTYDWLAAHGAWDAVEQVQVITARNATRQALNLRLQERLNPQGDKAPVRSPFRSGDKVICLKNGLFARVAGGRVEGLEYVANGDIGRVECFRGQAMWVTLKCPGRLVQVPLKRQRDDQPDDDTAAGDWDLAYCCTCHKYQGSECPVVVVVVEGAGKLGSREWVYTAFSRARELCVVVADLSDVARCVRRVTLPDRKTFLKELITGEMEA